MTAFLLWPIALLELGPLILHHTIRTLTTKKAP
jgi:hypothetical protein